MEEACGKIKSQVSAVQVRVNWHVLSICVSTNHGCVTTPLIFATTLLDERVGYYGSALLYVSICLCSLFTSVPITLALGQRSALFLAMLAYSAYVGLFAFATLLPVGSAGQYTVFLAGSCLGGAAASLLWTSQGGYLSRSSIALADATGCTLERATAKHASIFAVYYLLFEVAFKLFASVALQYDLHAWLVFAICLAFGIAAAFGVLTLHDFRPSGPSLSARLLGALAVWPDPALWCLAPANLTFGFSAAFLNGYVNAVYTKPQLGQEYVGYLSTATAFIAAAFSQIFGMGAIRTGRKGPFLFIGSLCFLAIPVVVLLVGGDKWGCLLVVPYVLQGCGRAVYESTNKGVLADFFEGERSDGAFANQMMQATLSFAVAFFCSATLSRKVLACIILTLASLTFPGFLVAHRLRRIQNAQNESEGSGSWSS